MVMGHGGRGVHVWSWVMEVGGTCVVMGHVGRGGTCMYCHGSCKLTFEISNITG